MRLAINKIYNFFFLLGLFFLPFNSWEGIMQLGEFKTESCAFFFLLGFLFLFLEVIFEYKIKLPINDVLFKILIIFLIWIIITIIFNSISIEDSYYKKTSGIIRFIRQYFSLLLSSLLFFSLYYNVVIKYSTIDLLMKIRKFLLFSFIAVSVYGFLEISYLFFDFVPSYHILKLLNYFPFTELTIHTGKRISSVTFEPPALATFLITVAGWMFSYIITNKGYIKYLPTFCVLILTYYSGSRTALIVILIQLFVFVYISLSKKQLFNIAIITSSFLTFFLLIVLISSSNKIVSDIEKKMQSLDFKGNLKTNVSNQSRFGIQYANFKVFLDNPITGVGYGQQGYHAINYYPLWAKKDNYEFDQIYLNKNHPNFPPGYNLYIRLMAETGLVGLIIFVLFLYFIIKKTKIIIKTGNFNEKVLGIILLTTFVGFIFNWLQLDTFRMHGFWIALAVLISLNYKISQND